jgi:hypothetical protein
MMTDIDRVDTYTRNIDGRTPGQPYDRQWWMTYYDVEIRQPSEQDRKVYGERACNIKARFKKNIFTRTVYVFRHNVNPEGNRWNESGYGWGIWEKL